MGQDPLIDQPPDIEKGVGDGIELDQSPHPVAGRARQHDDLPAARLVEGPVGKIEIEGEQQVDVRIGEDLAPCRR